MPWRPAYTAYKYVIIEADTRVLELFMAGVSAVWALWLNYVSSHAVTNVFWNVTAKHGGISLWGIWAFGNCALQITAIHFKRPMMRAWAAAACSFYWVFICGNLWGHKELFIFWISTLFAAASLWILLHRTSTGT